MGSAKHMLAERDEDHALAMGTLLRLKVLQQCSIHEDAIWDGSRDISEIYPLVNSMITKGEIKLRPGMSRRDFTDLLKSVYEDNSLADGCYYCNKD